MTEPSEANATTAVTAAAKALHDLYRAQSEARGVASPIEFEALPPLAQNQYREQVLPFVWAALCAITPAEPSPNPDEHRYIAECVLSMALTGGMPDTFWLTDLRITSACRVLGIEPSEARQHAERLAR